MLPALLPLELTTIRSRSRTRDFVDREEVLEGRGWECVSSTSSSSSGVAKLILVNFELESCEFNFGRLR
jgi:hypothetical protein